MIGFPLGICCVFLTSIGGFNARNEVISLEENLVRGKNLAA
jgi:hypothetical protein